MKTYDQLTPNQQSKAREKCLTRILEEILEGGLSFDGALNGNDLQKRIDAAIDRAQAMQTPWFAHEYILYTCRADLESMAVSDAESGLYPEPSENIINGVI